MLTASKHFARIL